MIEACSPTRPSPYRAAPTGGCEFVSRPSGCLHHPLRTEEAPLLQRISQNCRVPIFSWRLPSESAQSCGDLIPVHRSSVPTVCRIMRSSVPCRTSALSGVLFAIQMNYTHLC